MRLFVAIDMPAEIKEILTGLRVDMPGVRWVPPEQLHLTLLFLGEIAPESLDRLCNRLAAIALPPFRLTFDRTGCFPHHGSPKILWAGVKQQPALAGLARRIREAAEICGILTDEKPFAPHITLARVKQPTACNAAGFINRLISAKKLSIPVRNFILYQSRLTQQGALHDAIRQFPLSAPAG